MSHMQKTRVTVTHGFVHTTEDGQFLQQSTHSSHVGQRSEYSLTSDLALAWITSPVIPMRVAARLPVGMDNLSAIPVSVEREVRVKEAC